MLSIGPTQVWSGRARGFWRLYPWLRRGKSCWPPICTPETCFGPNVSHGLRLIRDQHLLNRAKARLDLAITIRRFAETAEVDPERVRLWTFAHAAAQPRDDWSSDFLLELARAIAP
jgi:hypothetical protein